MFLSRCGTAYRQQFLVVTLRWTGIQLMWKGIGVGAFVCYANWNQLSLFRKRKPLLYTRALDSFEFCL